jgi:hypothetical protein
VEGLAEVVRRGHGRGRVHDGWSCNGCGCRVVSTNGEVIRRHCGRAQRVKVKAGEVVSGVRLQRVFGSKVGYFMVTVVEVELRRLEGGPPPGATATTATATAAAATTAATAASAAAATTAATAASAAAAVERGIRVAAPAARLGAPRHATLPDRGHVVTG